MDDIKITVAGNLIALRKAAGMTQTDLAEKLNYSDKSVSKWERAESLPDVAVLKNIADIYGVSIDYLTSQQGQWEPADKPKQKTESGYRSGIITLIAIVSVWTLALLLFIVFWIMDIYLWIVFVYAVPISLITLLTLNSVWENGRNNYYIIAALVVSVFAALCVTLSIFGRNWWQILSLLIPAEVIVFLSSRVKKRKKQE